MFILYYIFYISKFISLQKKIVLRISIKFQFQTIDQQNV